jgi:peroxiredoxin
MIKPYYVLLCMAALLAGASCKRRPAVFVVKGNIAGLPPKASALEVYLTSVNFDNNKPVLIIDSTQIKDGKFELKGPGTEEALFRVMLGDPTGGPWMGVVDDNPEISLSMDVTQDGNYTVKGSPATQRFHILFDSLRVLLDNIQKDRLASVGGQGSGPDTAVAAARAAQGVKAFYGYLAQTVEEEPNPVVASFALNFYGIGASQDAATNDGVQDPSYDVAKLQALSQDLQKRFPSSTSVAAIAQAVQLTINIPRPGAIAPELSLPDTSGKVFSVSSLRGKFVLLDFWASWCEPCRQENPNVVKAYQEFKDKNFTVVGVSLDQQKDAWLEAINADHLTWTQISDLSNWQSKAVETFHFNAIPYNVLLDPQGRILAIGLRGDALEEKLQEVLQ